MIDRYTRPEMAKVWSEQNKYLAWLKVELAVSAAQASLKIIPPKVWRELRGKGEALIKKGGIDPERVAFHEKTTRHDVIAFTTAVAEKIGPSARYIHFGLTSSDVIDTAMALQIREAGMLIQKNLTELLKVLKKRAQEYKALPTIGRSHGIFAEPTSFGLKFLGWYEEWRRNADRFEAALLDCLYGQLSGAVGVNAHFAPQLEEKILKKLGLKREPVSTQVIPRDRHAALLSALAVMGSSMERIAVELRHLQRSEVAEVMEGFKKGQKGSSAMPHKRNPISSENLTGLARLLRSYSQAALENVALWHERDISHSSVERVIFPDAFIVMDYALNRLTNLVRELMVRRDQVRANLEKAGQTVYSGHYLLALVQAGAEREKAYYWIQECAHKDIEGKGKFVDLLCKHPDVKKYLNPKQIRKLGSTGYQLRHVSQIYSLAK